MIVEAVKKRFIIAVFVLGLLFTAAIPSFASYFNFYYPNSFVSTDEYAEGVGYTMSVQRNGVDESQVDDTFSVKVDSFTRSSVYAPNFEEYETVTRQGEGAYNPNLSTHVTEMFWDRYSGRQLNAPESVDYGWDTDTGHCWGYEYL